MIKKWNSQRRQRANEKHQLQPQKKEQRRKDKRKDVSEVQARQTHESAN